MWILDIILLFLGISAWVWSFISWSDSLYKLFLWLIIGFLSYLVISYQIEIALFTSPILINGYQEFLVDHSTAVLSFALFTIPVLGLIFMLNPRLRIRTRKKSVSQLLLGLLLPIFLIGIFAFLSEGSILSESETWKKIFSFLEQSGLYGVFQKLPSWIFLLLAFLIFYKSIFILLLAFGSWFLKHIIMQYFQSWKKGEKKSSSKPEEEYNDNFDEEID